jgi:hypothetical protein
MPLELSTYQGDAEHSINCTGDACEGDEVSFERATFEGSYRNLKFAGFEHIKGRIVKESYGAEKGQHTFTLDCAGTKLLIKGRNLHKEGLYRKPWADENLRRAVLHEKHLRGNRVRALKGFN